jgi:cell division protein FtsN
MTRDYKPERRPRKSPSSGSGSSLLVGIVIGLLLGLGIALGVAIYLNKVPAPFISRAKTSDASPGGTAEPPKGANKAKTEDTSAKATDKPRFDFYRILPGEDAGKDGKDKGSKEVPRATAPEYKEIFYLQAGAFQGAADADNMKARLALLGVEAQIQSSATADRGALYRVRVGPFSRVEELNRIRDTLKQNGIETTLIKGREGQS